MIARELSGSDIGVRILLGKSAADGYEEYVVGTLTSVQHLSDGSVILDLDAVGGHAAVTITGEVGVIRNPTR